MSSTRADRARSGSLAGLRLCMVMHVGNSGGSRAWQGLLGRPPDWGIDPPRSTGVRKGSSTGTGLCWGQRELVPPYRGGLANLARQLSRSLRLAWLLGRSAAVRCLA